MNSKTFLGLILCMCCAFVGVLALTRQPARKAEIASAFVHHDVRSMPSARPSAAPVKPTPVAIPAAATERPATKSVAAANARPMPKLPAHAAKRSLAQAKPGAGRFNQGVRLARAVISEPVARQALSFVGSDPVAGAVWVTAINDPNLSKDARSNLIEDLNEDGFLDPKNLTMDDLPLIVNRLQIIEELAPSAMDQANADAFQEAYKDLVNMYGRVAGF